MQFKNFEKNSLGLLLLLFNTNYVKLYNLNFKIKN